MATSIIYPPTVEELRTVLHPLPPPSYIEVALYGDWDISPLNAQAGILVPGLQLQMNDGVVYRVEDPSKKRVLDIYQSSMEILQPTEKKRGNPPRMHLQNVGWRSGDLRLEDVVKMELTPIPAEVNVSYHSSEPEYVAVLRQIVAETSFKLTITQKRL